MSSLRLFKGKNGLGAKLPTDLTLDDYSQGDMLFIIPPKLSNATFVFVS